MKKIYLFLAAAAMLLTTACSNDDAANGVALDSQTTAANLAVGFDTYTANNTTTRTGTAGVMTNTVMQKPQAEGGGFGVFAYQCEVGWSNTDKPTFMYNQLVTYSEPSWIYSPLKYWPNETGNTNIDGNSAIATKTERLTFFAYAPYVAAGNDGTLTGGATADIDYNDNPVTNVGITALTANDAEGAAKVSYQMAYTPNKSVDLLWGVAPAGGLDYQSVNPTNDGIYHVQRTEGMPLNDLVKPAKDQKIKFLFKHALARLGLSIVAADDQLSAGGVLDDNTRIYVNSIKITNNAKTVPASATLNLKNITAGVANWEYTAPTSALTFGVKPGGFINSKIIDSGDHRTNEGVNGTEKNVLLTDNDYFMLIPTPGHEAIFEVTVDYDVYTQDANVTGGFSKTNNVITKAITLNSTEVGHTGFTNNKAYKLKLVLGMTSVKLDAEVADWQIDGTSIVDLPRNNE